MKKGIMLIFIFCNIIVQGQVNRLVDAKGKEEVIAGLKCHVIQRDSYVYLWAEKFDKALKPYLSKMPGLVYPINSEWIDALWNEQVPQDLKNLITKVQKEVGKRTGLLSRIFDIFLYVDSEGKVLSVEYRMTDCFFEKLKALPKNVNLLELLTDRLLKMQYHQADIGKPDNEFDWKILNQLGLDLKSDTEFSTRYGVIRVCGTLLDMWGTIDMRKAIDGTSPKSPFPEIKNKNN